MLPLRRAGATATAIADCLGAPSRNAISTILERLKAQGELPGGRVLVRKPKPAPKPGRKEHNPEWDNRPQDEREADVIKLAIKQMPHADIAEKFGIAIGTVKGIVLRARKRGVVIPVVRTPGRSKRYPAPLRQPPKLRVITNLAMAIADFEAKGLVRRFEAKESSDYYAIKSWLRERGYELVCASGTFIINAPKKRVIGKLWRDVVAWVDTLRAAEGLQPFLRGATPQYAAKEAAIHA